MRGVLWGLVELHSTPTQRFRRLLEVLQTYSIPLLLGVPCALLWCNIDEHSYNDVMHHWELVPGAEVGADGEF